MTGALEHPPMPGWLAVPVKRPSGAPLGVLQLSDKFEGDFSEDDQRLLEQLATLIAATFEVEYIAERVELEKPEASVIAACPNAIVVVDGNEGIALVNVETERMFGYSKRELVRQQLEVVLPQSGREKQPVDGAESLEALKHRQTGDRLELVGLHKDGREFPVEIGLGSVETAEGPGTLWAITDITDRREAERAGAERTLGARALQRGTRAICLRGFA